STRLDRPTLMYASYRIGDDIYWTKHKLRLPEGEMVLTDGVNTIRARCGNMLAYQLPLPKPLDPPFEPPPLVFESGIPALQEALIIEPVASGPADADFSDRLPSVPLNAVPVAQRLVPATVRDVPVYWPPIVPPPVYCCTGGRRPPGGKNIPVQTPEPGTI